MKIFSSVQIKAWDKYTIENEPITSIDLMERASKTFVEWFVKKFPNEDLPIYIVCGNGNNGGDGLAIARLLQQKFYPVTVILCPISHQDSSDFIKNQHRLTKVQDLTVIPVSLGKEFPRLQEAGILIDALLGVGMNRPLQGYWADFIQHCNSLACTRVAVDIPSGLFADKVSTGPLINADYTFTFQAPKLAFFFPESERALGLWECRSIGLHPQFAESTQTPYFYFDKKQAANIWRPRTKFCHKGSFGHVLLIAGSYGKAGAALLAGKACLRSGAGLLTIHAPSCAYEILQIGLPEAMVDVDIHKYQLSQIPPLLPYSAVGIGCGIGTYPSVVKSVESLLQSCEVPLVLDADALNILAQNASLLKTLPPNSILTPHPKELERLFGSTGNSFDRLELVRRQSKELNCIIILKGAHSYTCLPDGSAYFNSTGNPGMATAGSGDVLTGIIAGLLAQRYPAPQAALLGVYLHGLAGDFAAKKMGHESLLAGDITEHLGVAFQEVASASAAGTK